MLMVVVAGLGALKTQKEVLASVAEMKAKALPLMDKASALATQVAIVTTDITPAIKDIAAKAAVITRHMEHISTLAREKADEFAPTISAANQTMAEANETVQDANRKTQEQIERVNGMVTSVLDVTAEVGRTIRHGMTIPAREMAGLASGLKAAFSALTGRPRGFGSSVEMHQPYRALAYRSRYEVPDDGTATEGYTVEAEYSNDNRNLDM